MSILIDVSRLRNLNLRGTNHNHQLVFAKEDKLLSYNQTDRCDFTALFLDLLYKKPFLPLAPTVGVLLDLN